MSPGGSRGGDNMLYHSHIEICRILLSLSLEKARVSADLIHGRIFISHLLGVEPEADRLIVAYSSSKLVNATVLNSPTLEFTATDHRKQHFSFEATAPEETRFEDRPAIQFALPRTLLRHNRREHPRIPVPADTALRCVADERGVIAFESHITDLSHDGLGCLIYDPDIKIKDGTLLRGCRIILPNGDEVVADLELRHASPIPLSDGTLAQSAGFRLRKKTDDFAKLLRQFMRELDRQ